MSPSTRLHRRPLIASLVADRPDTLLAVSGLGSSTWDLSAAGNDPRNFCFVGAMGQAAPFALGLAMARRDQIEGQLLLVVEATGRLDQEDQLGQAAARRARAHPGEHVRVPPLDALQALLEKLENGVRALGGSARAA